MASIEAINRQVGKLEQGNALAPVIVWHCQEAGRIMDVNGNSVGEFRLQEG